jgi:hypothetical protein
MGSPGRFAHGGSGLFITGNDIALSSLNIKMIMRVS